MDLRALISITRELTERRSPGETYTKKLSKLVMDWLASPETSWYRHVNRVISFHAGEGIFQTVGGNEGVGEVKVGESHITNAKLLGWIHYPQPEPQPQPDASPFTEHERQQIQNMVGMFLREAADRIWRESHGLE